MWREKCCESTFTQIPRFCLLSQLQTQPSFSQTSLNSSIIRLSKYKLKNTILKLIKSKHTHTHKNKNKKTKTKKKTKKKERKKTKDRSHLTHLDCVRDEYEQRLQAGPTALR